ncbi:MAG: hypothetical protein ACRDU8_01210 [Egibacteraceae bacterium]
MAEDLRRALDEAQAWLDDDDVVAVGQGEWSGHPAVNVHVVGEVAAGRFPAQLHGVPVVVRGGEGEIVVQPEDR